MKEVSDILDKQIEKEISGKDKTFIVNDKSYSQNSLKLKFYQYADTYMNNYGDPVYNKNKNLIGYLLYNNKYASMITYYNKDNLLCNKIFIREFDKSNLTFINEPSKY
jgi:V8-like Glu-specific endopeptidase